MFFHRLARRYPWLSFLARTLFIFLAAFSAALGFLTGSKSDLAGYDPHTFALGISMLFALACVAITLLIQRVRKLRTSLRKLELHNSTLADRNWELKEAEERARGLIEQQGDLILRRDAEGRITYVNDAYCHLVQQPRAQLIGSMSQPPLLVQGDVGVQADGTQVHDQQIMGPLGPRWIAWRESGCGSIPDARRSCKASAAMSPTAPRANRRWRARATAPMPPAALNRAFWPRCRMKSARRSMVFSA